MAQQRNERRTLRVSELRVQKRADGVSTISGYAAVFNSLSEEIWGFREQISPGAFSGVINDDVRCLFNHDEDYVLGRTSAGTLRLSEDDKGLFMECDLPDTQCARDLAVSIERGDVSGQSFSFITDSDEWNMQDGTQIRTITKVGALYDVGPVTFPAYPETDVAARARGEFVPQPPQPPETDMNAVRARLSNAEAWTKTRA